MRNVLQQTVTIFAALIVATMAVSAAVAPAVHSAALVA